MLNLVALVQTVWASVIEDCNSLMPDGAADSARCIGLCAHCTCRSTMPQACTRTVCNWLKRNNWPIRSVDLNILELSRPMSNARSFHFW